MVLRENGLQASQSGLTYILGGRGGISLVKNVYQLRAAARRLPTQEEGERGEEIKVGNGGTFKIALSCRGWNPPGRAGQLTLDSPPAALMTLARLTRAAPQSPLRILPRGTGTSLSPEPGGSAPQRGTA